MCAHGNGGREALSPGDRRGVPGASARGRGRAGGRLRRFMTVSAHGLPSGPLRARGAAGAGLCVTETGSPQELCASWGHSVSETDGRRGAPGEESGSSPPPAPSSPFATRALGPGLSGLPSDPQSLGDMQQPLQRTLTSPADAAGFLHGSRGSGGSSKDSSCDTDDFVMVPAQFPGRGPGFASL